MSSFEPLSSKMALKLLTFLALLVSASAQFFGRLPCVGFNCGRSPLGPCFGVACPPPPVFLSPPTPAPCLCGVLGCPPLPPPPPPWSSFALLRPSSRLPLLLPASESRVILRRFRLASSRLRAISSAGLRGSLTSSSLHSLLWTFHASDGRTLLLTSSEALKSFV
ncbi:hypothetical protein L596_028986 [Steinernema carpocapsae]|uniref:Secreted protein n=1 Tax=Steinernema carpocapsae TaxID=34508 RepID=A0A4U5LTA7_STECR|nr:hypothetical protein L596_028986 [Steinernema carpocapsae]